MSCGEVKSAIATQKSRLMKCSGCSRVLQNAHQTLDLCERELELSCAGGSSKPKVPIVRPPEDFVKKEPLPYTFLGCFQDGSRDMHEFTEGP